MDTRAALNAIKLERRALEASRSCLRAEAGGLKTNLAFGMRFATKDNARISAVVAVSTPPTEPALYCEPCREAANI
jgi:hypothetical protein